MEGLTILSFLVEGFTILSFLVESFTILMLGGYHCLGMGEYYLVYHAVCVGSMETRSKINHQRPAAPTHVCTCTCTGMLQASLPTSGRSTLFKGSNVSQVREGWEGGCSISADYLQTLSIEAYHHWPQKPLVPHYWVMSRLRYTAQNTFSMTWVDHILTPSTLKEA